MAIPGLGGESPPMGLFTKKPESLLDFSETGMPVVQTVTNPSQTPVQSRARDVRDVRVTAADPHGAPSQTIERRAPDPMASMSPSVTPVAVGHPSIPPPPSTARFGIEDALRLLRELPGRESSAVREAVQKTLEFMNVDLERLVEDAAVKDSSLESRASSLQREVEQHEALALAAKKQIAAIQMERTELEAAKIWMMESRAKASGSAAAHDLRGQEPIPLDRVVRGSPVNHNNDR
jgi:hypothetical protein